jgi:hypothetical protein
VGTAGGGGTGSGGAGEGGSSNGGGPSSCSATQDDFAAPTLDPSKWQTFVQSGTVEIVDERLTITPANVFQAVVRAETSFDLTGCSAWVEVPRALPPDALGEVVFSIEVTNEVQSGISIRHSSGSATQFAVVEDGNVASDAVPYDPVAHRWWRIRDDANVLHLETSPDGINFTPQLQQSHTLDLSVVRINLGGTGSSSNGTPLVEGPQFDNVNLAP